ncbi:leucine-rich repeat domain-containing protein [Hugenholtzia roseola]|uniref:leucine-rich repeat domain-containing protein n=1 Tax=Hugenholtzia roseola TaxID=1002 RepID=UPI00041C85F2|nr:leucine-rich repeat domain-containing protein [Hugenholtzia roseola]
MKTLLFALPFLFFTAFLFGQSKPCEHFEALMQKGEKDHHAKNYQEAISAYLAALADCSEKAPQAQVRIMAIFEELNRKKNQLENDLREKNKLVDKIYFTYENFAIAYSYINGSDKFYFIDKKGERIEKLGEWSKVEQFIYGFAKVKHHHQDFLLDTAGNRYSAAYQIADLSTQTKALDLTDTQFKAFPDEILERQQLEILMLNGNYLKYNDFKILPAKIAQLKNLKVLQLRYSQINHLPNAISDLNFLEKLDISFNQFNSLPKKLSELKNLTWLDLGWNQFHSLSSEIKDLKNLQFLGLGGNHLSELPKEIGELKNLKLLYLYSNKLSSLPTQIGALQDLKILYVYGNQLNNLPKEIGELKNLTTLNLGSNRLSSLPEEIGELRNLTSLSLGTNQFSQLPKAIGELKNLTSLGLGNNQLSSLPKEMGELKNLTYLVLSANPLPLEALNQTLVLLPQLEELHLGNLGLDTLPTAVLGLEKLRVLHLSNSKFLESDKKKSNNFSEAEKEKIRELLPNCEIYF